MCPPGARTPGLRLQHSPTLVGVPNQRLVKWVLPALVAVAGLACVVVALIYFTVTPADLPSLLPGHVDGNPSTQHYWKRGVAALVVALGLFAVAAIVATRARSALRR